MQVLSKKNAAEINMSKTTACKILHQKTNNVPFNYKLHPDWKKF
jgi:hypothetical protein